MPKMKTHSSSKKRFRKKQDGLIKRAKAYRRHHAWARNAKKDQKLRAGAYVHASDTKNIALLLPY